jgi:hypothetical protein
MFFLKKKNWWPIVPWRHFFFFLKFIREFVFLRFFWRYYKSFHETKMVHCNFLIVCKKYCFNYNKLEKDITKFRSENVDTVITNICICICIYIHIMRLLLLDIRICICIMRLLSIYAQLLWLLNTVTIHYPHMR